ncbi:MAG: DEAD/DEAH box helicase [Candidatus Colwellbacteria bacterium]
MNRRNNNRRYGGGSSPRRRPQPSRKYSGKRTIDISRYINANIESLEPVLYIPKHTFKDFPVGDALKANIATKGYTIPTPIQDQIIPQILQGLDVVGVANTGTGKTAAFLIPLIHKAQTNSKQQILIVTPTRELALQINEELGSFIKNMRMYSTCAVGGAPINRQIADLKRLNNFVIGTPGRIKDLIKRRVLDLSKFETIVLDEADRMLDMGFIKDMRYLVDQMPYVRQTLFFSATISREIEGLISEFLKDPIRISVKIGETAKNIHQDVVRIQRSSTKIDTLHDLLKDKDFDKVLVFGRTKHGVQKISNALTKRGFSSTAIHGNKSQSQRQKALKDFKSNRTRVLVATDVAARGLDIPDVSHVINFDIPATYDDYVHRIGRTGRIDKKGKALTFIEPGA